MGTIRAPTSAPIQRSLKISSTTKSLVKSFSRLSRRSLINLALRWLETETNPALFPYLQSNRDLEEEAEEDYLWEPATDVASLRKTYEQLKQEPGTKRDIIDRILDGDWRRGISLQQLAMLDLQHLQDNDTALRWSALKLVPLQTEEEDEDANAEPVKKKRRLSNPCQQIFPQFNPSSFLSALKSEISHSVRAHYYLSRLPAPYNLNLLRLYVDDTPYANPPLSSPQASSPFTDSTRTLYIALPDSCPYIYIAISGAGGSSTSKSSTSASTVTFTSNADIATLKRSVLTAIPRALSRPHARYSLQSTGLTARSLRTMCGLRGNGRMGASGGAYTIFTEGVAEGGGVDGSPLDIGQVRTKRRKVLAERDRNVDGGGGATAARKTLDHTEVKKNKEVKNEVARRFGLVGLEKIRATTASSAGGGVDDDDDDDEDDASITRKPITPIDRFHVKFEDEADEADEGENNGEPASSVLNLTFHGTDVFGGIRALAEAGYIRLDRMPAWMTGEEGVSGLCVRSMSGVGNGQGKGKEKRRRKLVGGMGGGA